MQDQVSHSQLNFNAPEFVPTALFMGSNPDSHELMYTDEYEFITAQDLDELEACEEWVSLVAHLDELEHDHLIALALRDAPPKTLMEIEKRVEEMAIAKQQHTRKSSAKGKGKAQQ